MARIAVMQKLAGSLMEEEAMGAPLPPQNGRWQRSSWAEPIVEMRAGCAGVTTAVVGLGSAVARVTVNPAAVTAGGRRALAAGAGYGACPLEGAGS